MDNSNVNMNNSIIGEDDENNQEEHDNGEMNYVDSVVEHADGLENVEDDGDDEENELVVLDPEHPLMRRFQNALKQQLSNQRERLRIELSELTEASKRMRKEREDIGVELYSAQQELSKHQMLLEQKHDDYSGIAKKREQTEALLKETRIAYDEVKMLVAKERKNMRDLMAEVENMHLKMYYMKNANEDVGSDVAIMKRAAEKAGAELSQAEVTKQKQDMLVQRLVESLDRLQEDISLYDAQAAAQKSETEAAREAKNEAGMEVQAIDMEKKQLMQQWNTALIGMNRRDEAYSAMMEALNQQQQQIHSRETEMESIQTSIKKEEEEHEKMTALLHKAENEMAQSKKKLNDALNKHDILKQEYGTCTRMLGEMEAHLKMVLNEKARKEADAKEVRKEIEREHAKKVELEKKVMDAVRAKVTQEKYAKYADKLAGQAQTHIRDKEQQQADLYNKIAQSELAKTQTQMFLDSLKKEGDQVEADIKNKGALIQKSQNEIGRRVIQIEHKQNQIDVLNKKLEQISGEQGGFELGPFELQIKHLQKQIEDEDTVIAEKQQTWLREQHYLVTLTESREKRAKEVDELQKQKIILSKRHLRTEADMELATKAIHQTKREIRNLQNDIHKLNGRLHKEKAGHENLEKENMLMEHSFIGELREAENLSIELQAKLDELRQQKEALLENLVDAEQQIMLWERKIQLSKETRAAVDSDIGQGDIRSMRFEIHRMEVRHQQLMKQQEKMITEMEKSVSRRDTIQVRGEASIKAKNIQTKSTFERKLQETKRKTKQTALEADHCDEQIDQVKTEQVMLDTELEQKQMQMQKMLHGLDDLDRQIAELTHIKAENLDLIVSLQSKVKMLQQVREGKYQRVQKQDEQLDSDVKRAEDRLGHLSDAVDAVAGRFPQMENDLQGVANKVTACEAYLRTQRVEKPPDVATSSSPRT